MREMKDSGIEWIGVIPENWEKVYLKTYYDFEKGKNAALYTKEFIDQNNGEYPVYSGQTENNGIMGEINTFDYNLEECLFTTTVGAKVMTPRILKGKFSLSQNCLIMKRKKTINNKYIFYTLLTMFDYEKSMIPSYMQPSLRVEDLKKYYFYIPDLIEQEKIAKFLDKKIIEIDNVIEKTKETIEDYKKYKKNFIIKVTTKGLDKNAEMKDTDSGWIGKIPKHWDFVRINTLFHTVDERNEDENAMLLSLYTSIGVKPRSELEEKGNKAVTVLNYKKVKENDIIVNKLLAWMGAIAYSDYEGVTSPDYDVYRAREKANAVRNYYNAYFRYTNFNGDCHRYGHGIMLMRWRTYPEELLRIKVPNPPYDEQVKIAKAIDDKCSEIDKLIENKEKIIEELEQYKKSLIYEYVTGKKEVV